MIVDTSALICILLEEENWEVCARVIFDAPTCCMSTANLFEVYLVLHGRRLDNEAESVSRLIETFKLQIVPVTIEHVELAREAFRIYGKGINPASKLNYGDCFAFALAKQTGDPLLFVGNDFIHTDLMPVLDQRLFPR